MPEILVVGWLAASEELARSPGTIEHTRHPRAFTYGVTPFVLCSRFEIRYLLNVDVVSDIGRISNNDSIHFQSFGGVSSGIYVRGPSEPNCSCSWDYKNDGKSKIGLPMLSKRHFTDTVILAVYYRLIWHCRTTLQKIPHPYYTNPVNHNQPAHGYPSTLCL